MRKETVPFFFLLSLCVLKTQVGFKRVDVQRILIVHRLCGFLLDTEKDFDEDVKISSTRVV